MNQSLPLSLKPLLGLKKSGISLNGIKNTPQFWYPTGRKTIQLLEYNESILYSMFKFLSMFNLNMQNSQYLNLFKVSNLLVGIYFSLVCDAFHWPWLTTQATMSKSQNFNGALKFSILKSFNIYEKNPKLIIFVLLTFKYTFFAVFV